MDYQVRLSLCWNCWRSELPVAPIGRSSPKTENGRGTIVTATTRDKMEFVYLMAKHAPQATMSDIQRLLRLGAGLNRLAELHCNDVCRDCDEAGGYCRKQRRLENKIVSLCIGCGIKAKFQHDPRGATVKLRLPDGYGNDFGGEGLLCVPTS